MPIREDEYLPSHEELTVPEVRVTSGVYRAASLYLGKYCDNISKDFMLCKSESRGDPRRCINEGKEVTRCEMDFFQQLKANCYESFTSYWQCIDNATNMDFKYCRKSQKVFDECIGKTMNIERPPIGYFIKVRIHDTDRPRPQFEELELPPEAPKAEIKERAEQPPSQYPKDGQNW